MNATSVFEERKPAFLEQIEAAQGAQARVDAARFVIEQIACVLAQEEADAQARQRQQAVIALAARSPSLLQAAQAQGELVIAPIQKKSEQKGFRLDAKTVGAVILAVLGAHELIDGQWIYAALQMMGCGLMLFGNGMLSALTARNGRAQARGVLQMDANVLLDQIGALCHAADVCVSDLALLEKEAGIGRLSGTADEATLDLLVAMMEAKASGRQEAAVRTLDQAQQYLHRLGVEVVMYSAENEQYFDVLPTLSGERTIRPALMQDGKLIRRGVAASQKERSVGA